MKKINISILVFLMTATITLAQYQPGSRLLTVTGGWSLMNIEESSNSVGGFETGLSLEQTSFNGKWAYGASWTFVQIKEDVASDRAFYRTGPLTFQGKYLFGGSGAKGFVQTNLGFHNSRVTWNGTRADLQSWDYGFALGAGGGIQKYISEKAFVTMGYNIKWLQNSFFKDGLLHTFYGGLGFQFP